MTFLSRFRTRAAAQIAALCLALVATGVDDDALFVDDAAGGGTLELTCGIDLSAIESLGLPGEMGSDDSDNSCGRDQWALLPAGSVTVEDYAETVDGKAMHGIRVRAPFASAGQLNELIAVAQVAGEGETDTTLGSALTLACDGGTCSLFGQISPLVPGDDESSGIAAALLAGARRSLSVTLPGQVLAADADARDGQTYTWRQDPTNSAPRSVSVVWNPAGQSSASANPITPTPAPQPTRTPTPTRTPAPTPTPRPMLGPQLSRLTTATRVYGQLGDFTTNEGSKGGVNANTLEFPFAVAADRAGGLYVADPDRYRVLYFPAGSTTATRVYGQQGSFTTNSPNRGGVSAQSLHSPMGLALDASGGLYVADGGNSRVLYYPAGQATAARVYGQLGDFMTDEAAKGSVHPTADTLSLPRGVAVDAAGGLYVADPDDERVLYFPAGSTTAARVYGQGGDFTSSELNSGEISATSLRDPSGVALDSAGNLDIADAYNSRVLMFPTS